MNKDGTIHHIEIYVSDLKRSAGFWKWLLTKKFSYKQLSKWDSGVSFGLGNTYFTFVQTEKKYIKSPYHRKKTGLNHLAFRCSSRRFVDKLTIELKRRSINILYADKHPFAGGDDYYAVFFEDPDRMKVEVVVDDMH